MRRLVALSEAALSSRRSPLGARSLASSSGSFASSPEAASSSSASSSSSSSPIGFAWDDEGEVSALRARLRAALAERRSSASLASTSGSGFGVGFGGRFGYGATPPWDASSSSARPSSDAGASPTASPAYDPSAFDEYFAWRPALVLRRALEIALRLGDVGARVYVKRGDIQDRAARLRRHLTALGPAFVKLGQVLSTRADVLPASYCRELAELQDNLPPAPREHAAALLEREMGGVPVASLFAHELPPEPVAAASLAQVYRARLRDGPEVAVKLQRPGLAAAVALDATILRAMARVARTLFPLRSDVVGIVDELVGRIFDEMDYVAEAASAARFGADYAGDGGAGAGLAGLVRAPRIVPELSTRAVLVMEWIDGARLTDVDAMLASGLAPKDALDRGVRCSLHQLLGTGFMHSDPHPGNLVVARDGALVYLDFGMVVEVPETARRAMIRGLVGFVNRDAASLVDDLAVLDFLPAETNRAAAAEALDAVFHGVAGESEGDSASSSDASASTPNVGGSMPTGSAVRGTNDFLGVVSQLTTALAAHGFRLPPYFARVLRALAALEGTATGIDPDFRVIERAYPHVLARVVADRSPEMREVLRRLVLEEDGVSVRWSRVRRLAGAYAAAEASDADAPKNAGEKKTKESKETCAVTRAVRCAAETAAGVFEGARAVAAGTEPETESSNLDGSDSDSAAAAAAEAVRDAARYVMSPDGAALRAGLVRDFLDASDAGIAALADEATGAGGSGSVSDAWEFEELARLAEAGRRAYLRAPRTWAPVLAETVTRPEAVEMAARVAEGLGERATCENARLVARKVVAEVARNM